MRRILRGPPRWICVGPITPERPPALRSEATWTFLPGPGEVWRAMLQSVAGMNAHG